MNAARFESFLRSLSAAPSRRSALRLLIVVVLGNPLALAIAGTEAHDARKKCKKIEDKDKRKKCLRRARAHNAVHATPPGFCADKADGTNCGVCQVCRDGVCELEADNTPCGSGGPNKCCSGQCVDTSDDLNNCVSCGNVCGAGATCFGNTGCECLDGTFCSGATMACCGVVGGEEQDCVDTACPGGVFDVEHCRCTCQLGSTPFLATCTPTESVCCPSPSGVDAVCSPMANSNVCENDGAGGAVRCCLPDGAACTHKCECCNLDCDGTCFNR